MHDDRCVETGWSVQGRFLRDLSSHRRRSVRGGRLGLVKGCPHVLHAAWLWSPPTTPGSLKPHVEEPLRVCRILNARTSVALCIRGKRKAEHARPCVCSRSRQSGTTYERASANRLCLRADRWRQLQYRYRQHSSHKCSVSLIHMCTSTKVRFKPCTLGLICGRAPPPGSHTACSTEDSEIVVGRRRLSQ